MTSKSTRCTCDSGDQLVQLTTTAAVFDSEATRDTRTFQYDWSLSQLGDLRPGETLEYEVVAADFRPQQGSSGVRKLTIVAASELVRRFEQRRFEMRQAGSRISCKLRKPCGRRSPASNTGSNSPTNCWRTTSTGCKRRS